MNNWIIELTRLNGKPFEVDVRWITKLVARNDLGTDVYHDGKKKPSPCKEGILEVAAKMSAAVGRLRE